MKNILLSIFFIFILCECYAQNVTTTPWWFSKRCEQGSMCIYEVRGIIKHEDYYDTKHKEHCFSGTASNFYVRIDSLFIHNRAGEANMHDDYLWDSQNTKILIFNFLKEKLCREYYKYLGEIRKTRYNDLLDKVRTLWQCNCQSNAYVDIYVKKQLMIFVCHEEFSPQQNTKVTFERGKWGRVIVNIE